MNAFLWILQGVLAVAFFGAGAMKLVQPFEKLAADPKMGWVKDAGANVVRLAGATEVAAAAALVLPGVLGVLPVLTPLAGFGLALQMGIAALWIHRPRGEKQMMAANAVLLLLALVVGVGRLISPL